jgi:hypothetical protein
MAYINQKREFDKRSNTRTFSAGDIVYVIRPHSSHLAQKFQPQYEEPLSIINQKINPTTTMSFRIALKKIEPGPFTSI